MKKSLEKIKIKDLLDFSLLEVKEKEFISKLDLELLLAKTLNVERISIHVHPNKVLSESEVNNFLKLVDRRKSGEPIQYILGVKEFMGMDFSVEKGVLIPRNDTEVLVESIIGILNNEKRDLLGLEIGVGSGAISVSLLHYLKNLKIIGLDINSKALEITNKNAVNNNVNNRLELLHSDLFKSIKKDNKYDFIVSNPPYIDINEYENIETQVRDYEPEEALFAEDEGLYFYKKIIRESRDFLKKSGFLIVEIGYDQGEKVSELFKINTYKNIKIIKDLENRDRVVIGYLLN